MSCHVMLCNTLQHNTRVKEREQNRGEKEETETQMAGESQQVMKNITRVKDPKKRIDGYYVRIQWKKQSYSKFFSVNEYETEHNAFHRAIAWRNEKEDEIGKPRTERIICGLHPYTRRTNTGEKGIQRRLIHHYTNGKPVGKPHWYYIVTAIDRTGKMRRTGISIDKHGDEKALKLARQRYHTLKNSS